MDVEALAEPARSAGIMELPTTVVYEQGRESNRITGHMALALADYVAARNSDLGSSAVPDLHARLNKLVRQHKVMLFMKVRRVLHDTCVGPRRVDVSIIQWGVSIKSTCWMNDPVNLRICIHASRMHLPDDQSILPHFS